MLIQAKNQEVIMYHIGDQDYKPSMETLETLQDVLADLQPGDVDLDVFEKACPGIPIRKTVFPKLPTDTPLFWQLTYIEPELYQFSEEEREGWENVFNHSEDEKTIIFVSSFIKVKRIEK